MNLVFDSGALLAVLQNEEGADVVLSLLNDTGNSCFIHALNAVEVFYQVSRAVDVLQARALLNGFLSRGLLERTDMDAGFREDVAQLKADWRRVSFADCCGIALARRLDAEFVTADHHELDVLSISNVAVFRFFR